VGSGGGSTGDAPRWHAGVGKHVMAAAVRQVHTARRLRDSHAQVLTRAIQAGGEGPPAWQVLQARGATEVDGRG
jgi:hypothetical protein